MSVTAVSYQADQHRRGPQHPNAARVWSRRSTEHPDCVITRVEGELDAVLHDDLRRVLGNCYLLRCPVVLLDLRATTFMSIRAAAILTEAKADAWRVGVELRLVSGRREVERALEVAGVRPLFRYFSTLRAASTN